MKLSAIRQKVNDPHGVLTTCSLSPPPPKVHGMYRTTGASFEKAQQEFASGVMSNKTVQTAAARAAQESFKEQI